MTKNKIPSLINEALNIDGLLSTKEELLDDLDLYEKRFRDLIASIEAKLDQMAIAKYSHFKEQWAEAIKKDLAELKGLL
jgi:hypothetical protein